MVRRGGLVATLVAAACLVAGLPTPASAATATALEFVPVVTGLSAPTQVAAAPGQPGRLFVAELPGTVRVVDRASGVVAAAPFLDLTAQVLTGGERGLLGLTFDPDFVNSGRLFVAFTRDDPANLEDGALAPAPGPAPAPAPTVPGPAPPTVPAPPVAPSAAPPRVVPARVRQVTALRTGPRGVALDWRRPRGGPRPDAYRVQARRPGTGWRVVERARPARPTRWLWRDAPRRVTRARVAAVAGGVRGPWSAPARVTRGA